MTNNCRTKPGESNFFVEYVENQSIGALVSGINLSYLPSDEIIDSIKTLLTKRLVVIFRGQSLSPIEQLTFAQRFGRLNDYKPQEYGDSEMAGIIYVSNTKEGGHLGSGEVIWHSDSSFHEIPPKFTFLFAETVPEIGGETSWVNMYEAYQRLTDEMKRDFAALSVRHDNLYNAVKQPRQLLLRSSGPIPPGAVHSLIRVHPDTGMPTVFIGRVERNIIEGLSESQSEPILRGILNRAVANPGAVWEHRWKQGDFAIWDNRCTMHRRNPFAGSQPRVMRRCEVK